jgi:sulfur carrier protein
MRVNVNGDFGELPDGTTVDDVVVQLGKGRKGVAVAVNDEVVSRSSWTTTQLAEDDRVEILTAAQGG